MKVEIIKNKNGESIYPLGHAEATMYDDEKTVKDAVPFRFGIVDGQYGYFDESEGADTFIPFKSGGSSKPTYLIVNQGNGINVLDFSNFEETYYTNSEMMSGIVQITPWFHVIFNTIQRNCLTLVADDKISVCWRRAASYPKEDLSLNSGEYNLLWSAGETNGYAVVICCEDE